MIPKLTHSSWQKIGLSVLLIGAALAIIVSLDQEFRWFGLGFFVVIFLLATELPTKIKQRGGRSFLRQKQADLSGVSAKNEQSTSISLDHLPVALVSVDENGAVSYANDAAASLLGLNLAKQEKFSDLVEIPGQNSMDWLRTEITNKHQDLSDPQPIIMKAKRAQQERYLQAQISFSQDEKTRRHMIAFYDVTEKKSLEVQIVQSQKMQAIGQLAGGVAHDFNNLLTAISGYCDLLLLRHEKGDPDYAYLHQISSNSNRAAALVGQLLAFSRKQTMKPQATQLDDTIADMTHLLNRLVGEKIVLRFDRSKNLPLAFVDSRQIEQVIMNLVVNARDAMPEGGKIWLRTRSLHFKAAQVVSGVKVNAGHYVCVDVEDNGIGMAPDILRKIFDPFFSTKNVGEGTGLGLSTVYGIIKQTGGFILVDSEVEVGSVFRVLLPVATELQRPRQIEPVKLTNKLETLAGSLVLLVEDEEPVRAFASSALKMQGVNLIEAQNGEEALEIVKVHGDKLDVIISDVVMPELNGPDWVEKGRKYCPNAKIIFVSGYAEESLSDDDIKFGDCLFLAKPFSLKDLVATVSKCISDKADKKVA